MQGFDRAAARAFVLQRLDPRGFRALAGQEAALVDQAIDADLAYMLDAGVLTKDGAAGDRYYDDDDAYEFILDHMARVRRTPDSRMDSLCDFIEQYMELIEQYMTEAGLLNWE